MKVRLIVLLSLVVLVSSCVKTDKLIYLQGVDDPERATSGALLKSYPLNDYEYRLRPDDIISVKVHSFDNEDFNFFTQSEASLNSVGGDPVLSGFVVDKTGYIDLPVVGKIMVQGLTLKESQDVIKSAVAEALIQPTVMVKLLSFNFTVVGEFNGSGRYTNYTTKLTIFEAVAMAGDLTDFADRSKIKLVRYENDNAKTYYLDLLSDEIISSPYYYLQPNDLLIAEPMEVRTTRLYTIANFGIGLSMLSFILLISNTVNNLTRTRNN